jgi:alpha-galactosidase
LQATNDYVYCSIDSGWSVGDSGDQYGRIIPDTSKFNDLPGLASYLHGKGIKLGLYLLPGAFEADASKTVFGTNIQIGYLFNNSVDPSGETSNSFYARVNFDYSQDGVQQWHNSVVNLLASWLVTLLVTGALSSD